MTAEEMEHAINFLLDHNAKVSGDIERLTADVQALREAQAEQGRMLESVISEMRDGFNNLIVANEVTRKLSEDIARLTVQNSQRMTQLEKRVDDLELGRE